MKFQTCEPSDVPLPQRRGNNTVSAYDKMAEQVKKGLVVKVEIPARHMQKPGRFRSVIFNCVARRGLHERLSSSVVDGFVWLYPRKMKRSNAKAQAECDKRNAEVVG